MKNLISVVLFLFIFCQPISAQNTNEKSDIIENSRGDLDDTDDPDDLNDVNRIGDLLRETVNLIFEILQDESLDHKVKDERLISALSLIFDFERMAKNSLGKKYWDRIKKEKQEEFTEVFIKHARESFITQLISFNNESIEFEKAIEVRKKRIYLKSLLVSKDGDTEIVYKFYKYWRKDWKVYDLKIHGVSMTQTYREQFRYIMENWWIDELLLILNPFGEFAEDNKKL